MNGGTPRGTPEGVVVRPETVIVMAGTTRLLARNWIVVDVGTRRAPAWDVVLLSGVDGHVRCWVAERHRDRHEAENAAVRYAAGGWPARWTRGNSGRSSWERPAEQPCAQGDLFPQESAS